MKRSIWPALRLRRVAGVRQRCTRPHCQSRGTQEAGLELEGHTTRRSFRRSPAVSRWRSGSAAEDVPPSPPCPAAWPSSPTATGGPRTSTPSPATANSPHHKPGRWPAGKPRGGGHYRSRHLTAADDVPAAAGEDRPGTRSRASRSAHRSMTARSISSATSSVSDHAGPESGRLPHSRRPARTVSASSWPRLASRRNAAPPDRVRLVAESPQSLGRRRSRG